MTPVSVAPVTRTALVRCAPDRAFAVFTDEIGRWWPLSTHSIFGAETAGVAFVDGQLVERATDGRTSVWGAVVEWSPPFRLAFTWHVGRDPDPHTLVTVSFRPEGSATRVDLEHSGWEAYGATAETDREGYASDSGWTSVFGQFAAAAAGRRP
jgi:uncharacterized protein YndB with AHSA1/START domain